MVRYITSQGEKFPVKYGFNAYMDLGRMLNKKFSEIENIFSGFEGKDMGVEDFETVGAVILVGLKEGARKDGVECSIQTIQDVFDQFDLDKEFFNKVIAVFHESQAKPDPAGGEVGKRKPRK